MDKFTVKVEGEKELMQALTRLYGKKLAESKRLIADSGQEIVGEARRVAPVVTGRLRNSVSILEKRGDGLGLVVGTNVEYAPFIEYGTRKMEAAHGEHDPQNPVTDWAALRKRGGSGQQMPFLTPAFLRVREKFMAELIKIMRRVR